jgi:hypothetical protein
MRENPKKLSVAVATLVVLAFVTGASAGVAGDRLVAPRLTIRTTLGDMSGTLDRLGLTTEQRRQADAIVARSAPRSREVLIELGERLRLVADSVDAELRSILTAEQRLRLDSLRTAPRLMLKRKLDGQKVDTILDTGFVIRRR